MVVDNRQTASSAIRVLIADKHALVRSGLVKIIETEADLQFVGEAENGQAAATLTIQRRPHVLLLDWDLLEVSGVQILRVTKTILLKARIERPQIVESVRLGARAVFPKEASPDLLLKCIRSVAAGHYWIDQGGVRDRSKALRKLTRTPELPKDGKNFGLTAREWEIVEAVVLGYRNQIIAERLHVSGHTVKNHLTSIFQKLGVSSRLELGVIAAKNLIAV